MQFTPQRRSLCGQVGDDIGQRILAGDILPGQPLPQEWTLCDEMGVSRTVVREAIKALTAHDAPTRSWRRQH